jgi:hypothetical protein
MGWIPDDLYVGNPGGLGTEPIRIYPHPEHLDGLSRLRPFFPKAQLVFPAFHVSLPNTVCTTLAMGLCLMEPPTGMPRINGWAHDFVFHSPK